MKKNNDFIGSFSDFIADPDGFSMEELSAKLGDQGIDVTKLQTRVAEIVKKGSEKRRLAWRVRAKEKREEIENLLESKRTKFSEGNLKEKIKKILVGGYGQEALTFAEAYFRKKDTPAEEDLESLIEDLNDLNLLRKIDGED